MREEMWRAEEADLLGWEGVEGGRLLLFSTKYIRIIVSILDA